MFVTDIRGGFAVFGKIPVIALAYLNLSDVNLSRTSNFRNVFLLPSVYMGNAYLLGASEQIFKAGAAFNHHPI